VHLIVDPQRTLEEVHAVSDEIERQIRERLPGSIVTTHLEPDDGRYRGPLERTIHSRS
jgi:divalent metal cation (Fe/Co/Zn/Cd) transporter